MKSAFEYRSASPVVVGVVGVIFRDDVALGRIGVRVLSVGEFEGLLNDVVGLSGRGDVAAGVGVGVGVFSGILPAGRNNGR